MKTNLTFNLKVGFFQGRSMTLQILSNQQELWPSTGFERPVEQITLQVDLPARIEFVLSNRNRSDTEIDKDGNILQDKFIHLESLVVFDTLIESYKISQDVMVYRDNDQEIINPSFFWNKNGKAILDIDQSDPLCWLLHHQELW